MLIENLDWENRLVVVPDSKTSNAATSYSDEPSRLRAFECTLWRNKGGLGASFQAYCFGSLVLCRSLVSRAAAAVWLFERTGPTVPTMTMVLGCLMRTGNLAAVMRTIGHRSVKTAMHYQHRELEIVRAALDHRMHNDVATTVA
jgi:hypothetical protein